MGTLKQDLCKPDLDLIETHTSWVFLAKQTVWKVKKPVNFGFLDFTTLERRKQACEAELSLNARLAPGVYRAVVPVTRDRAGHHSVGGAGDIVDYAVEMVRLPEACRADILVTEGALSLEHIDRIATTIATFHERMPSSERIAEFGSPEVLLENVRENFTQTLDTITEYLDTEQIEEIQAQQLAFIEEHRDLFIARMIAGKVRDGHGDLRLEHVYLLPDREPTVIDCIEFNERFRYADVCSDLAFLTMDLARFGRVDLSERLLASYASLTDDFDLYRLIDFYEGYRAFVRGKVASLLVADAGAAAEARDQARRLARRHYLLALASGRRSVNRPLVVAVGGIIGSGKSTLAERVSRLIAAPVVSTDRTRKHWLGLTPTSQINEPAWTGAYAPRFSERIYAEVLRRAASVLASGRPVILDGSFRSRRERGRARLLARQMKLPFLFVECRTDASVCHARLQRRAKEASISDARVDLFDDFVAHFEPVTELPENEHVVANTSLDIEASLRPVAEVLPVWPANH